MILNALHNTTRAFRSALIAVQHGGVILHYSGASASSQAAIFQNNASSDETADRRTSGTEATSSKGPIRRRAGGKALPALGGRVVSSSAPWPFIDASRPTNVLPRYVELESNMRERRRPVQLALALEQVKANSTARLAGSDRDTLSGRPRCRSAFDETVELIANLSVNPRKADQVVRGAMTLPHGTGSRVTICVFAAGADAEIAVKEGADVIGDEALIASIIEGGAKAVAFDKLIATPEFIKPLAKAGRVLGPKGLMPNVKLGTLTTDVAAAIREMRRGRLDFRCDRDGIVHAGVGKVSFPSDHLALNISAFVGALVSNRPRSVLGHGTQGYIKSVFIKSSMTAAVPVTLDSFGASSGGTDLG